jgi:hypothetical protein
MLLMDVWATVAAAGAVCGGNGKTTVLHAVTPEMVLARLGDKRKTMDAPCGTKVRIVTGDVGVFTWPPRVASLPAPWVRCSDCHRATGSKRPAKEWA